MFAHTSDTGCASWAFPPPSSSATSPGCPTIQLRSDTVYLETVSHSSDEGDSAASDAGCKEQVPGYPPCLSGLATSEGSAGLPHPGFDCLPGQPAEHRHSYLVYQSLKDVTKGGHPDEEIHGASSEGSLAPELLTPWRRVCHLPACVQQPGSSLNPTLFGLYGAPSCGLSRLITPSSSPSQGFQARDPPPSRSHPESPP